MNFTIQNYQKIVHTLYTRTIITLHSHVFMSKLYCGIDPGSANMGIAVYSKSNIILNQIKFKPEKDPVQKILNICSVVKDCVPKDFGYAVVEGASYGETFGQVELSEARTAAIMTLCQLNFTVHKISPKQIRKLALGNGNNKGECFELPSDATASFLACLVAMQLG